MNEQELKTRKKYTYLIGEYNKRFKNGFPRYELPRFYTIEEQIEILEECLRENKEHSFKIKKYANY